MVVWRAEMTVDSMADLWDHYLVELTAARMAGTTVETTAARMAGTTAELTAAMTVEL